MLFPGEDPAQITIPDVHDVENALQGTQVGLEHWTFNG